MAKVVFHCKDALVVEHCEKEFGPKFQGWLDKAQSVGGREGALRRMQADLRKEAKRQEWFDYTIEWENSGLGDGVTHSRCRLIRDHEGRVEYLVPTVVIEE